MIIYQEHNSLRVHEKSKRSIDDEKNKLDEEVKW